MGNTKKTKGKTQRHHMRHEGLLGLTYWQPRSGQLDNVVPHSREGTAYVG